MTRGFLQVQGLGFSGANAAVVKCTRYTLPNILAQLALELP